MEKEVNGAEILARADKLEAEWGQGREEMEV